MGKENMVGVPTMRGIGESFKDFGLGVVGGLIFLVAYRLFGGLGLVAAPLIAGSMMKGDRGQIISTMSGFMIMALGALAVTGGGTTDSGEM